MAGDGDLTESERAELAALRARAAGAGSGAGGGPGSSPGAGAGAGPGAGPGAGSGAGSGGGAGGGRGPHGHDGGALAHGARWVGAIVLLLVSALLFLTSVVAVYARSELLNTDRYVETVAPLARDPAIQDAITNRLSDAVIQKLDLAGLTQQVVASLEQRGAPKVLNTLVAPAVNGLTSFITTQIHNVVSSDQFAEIWDSANRKVHGEIDSVLTTGQGQLLTVKGTEVSIELGAVLELVKQRLVEQGFGLAAKIPAVSISLPLFKADQLPKIRTWVAWLNTAAWLLPLVALALFIAAIVVAPNRRRAIVVGAVTLAVTMGLLLLILDLARSYYLNHLPSDVKSPDAVRVLYDTMTRFLIQSVQTLLVVFVVIAVLLWLAGPGRVATVLRHAVGYLLTATARGLSATGAPLGPVPAWARESRRAVAVGLLIASLAVLVLWRHPGISGVIWVTVIALVLLGLVEILARVEPAPPGDQAARAAPA